MNKKHVYIVFLILCSLFFVPLILATVYFNSVDSNTLKTKQAGIFLHPAVKLEDEELKKALNGSWGLMLVSKSCDALCEGNINSLHRVQLALHKHSSRVRRVLLTEEPVTKNYPELYVASQANLQLSPGVYIIDPQGLVILSYPSTGKLKGIYADLNHLLKVAQVR